MKFIYALLTLFTISAHANIIQLESGPFIVNPVDRYGNVQTCTFEIQNFQEERLLVLNVNDCPPVISNVRLYQEPNDTYVSDIVPADTSSREGHKVYEIHPISPKQFKMVSYRIYSNGQVDKPRSIIATKK